MGGAQRDGTGERAERTAEAADILLEVVVEGLGGEIVDLEADAVVGGRVVLAAARPSPNPRRSSSDTRMFRA